MARAFPLYSSTSRKRPAGAASTAAPAPSRNVSVYLRVPRESWPATRTDVAAAAEGIQLAARLVDTPPNVLHTSAFIEEAMAVARGLGGGVTMKVIRGDDLARQGFGGLYGVGKAAVEPPALVVLTSHAVEETEERERKRTIESSLGTGGGGGGGGGGCGGVLMGPLGQRRGQGQGHQGSVCFVGKGIVYDTGGLSIKTKTGMVGFMAGMVVVVAVVAFFLSQWSINSLVYTRTRTYIRVPLANLFYKILDVLSIFTVNPG